MVSSTRIHTHVHACADRLSLIQCLNTVRCVVLQDCAGIPSDCRLEAATAGASTAALDLCTVEGTTAGAQVPDVFSAATYVLPAGSCFETTDCSRWPGQVCNKQITRDVKTCSGGVDGFLTLGTCARTPCQTCKVMGYGGSGGSSWMVRGWMA